METRTLARAFFHRCLTGGRYVGHWSSDLHENSAAECPPFSRYVSISRHQVCTLKKIETNLSLEKKMQNHKFTALIEQLSNTPPTKLHIHRWPDRARYASSTSFCDISSFLSLWIPLGSSGFSRSMSCKLPCGTRSSPNFNSDCNYHWIIGVDMSGQIPTIYFGQDSLLKYHPYQLRLFKMAKERGSGPLGPTFFGGRPRGEMFHGIRTSFPTVFVGVFPISTPRSPRGSGNWWPQNPPLRQSRAICQSAATLLATYHDSSWAGQMYTLRLCIP